MNTCGELYKKMRGGNLMTFSNLNDSVAVKVIRKDDPSMLIISAKFDPYNLGLLGLCRVMTPS